MDETLPRDNLLGENDFIEGWAIIGYADKTKVQLHEKIIPDMRARFAMALLEKWGMVMVAEDGFDEAGRQKLRRMGPREVAGYACDTAGLAFDEFKDRGWIVPIGGMDNVSDKAKETN